MSRPEPARGQGPTDTAFDAGPLDGAWSALDAAWVALTAGDPGACDPPPLQVSGRRGHLASHLPVEEVAIACIGTALRAASALPQRRSEPAREVRLDRAHMAAAVRSEGHFRRGGKPAAPGFAPFSRFWRTADGWVRTHGNYPWHRSALLRAVGCASDTDADGVAGAMAALDAEEVEERVVAAGGVAAGVRALDVWRRHPQGRALGEDRLIGNQVLGNAAPRRPREPRGADLPAQGIRVLDLTRVIAGPVCTRFLGALGAEVLRIDPPGHLDMAPGVLADTLLGKRSAFLDLAAAEGLARLHELLDGADVVVHGYRPGSLDRFGLGAGALAGRHPGLVVVHLNAWGHLGPWSARRGFDSIVQAACGIATAESVDGIEPGALPCQLLDHGTGYLAAAAALDGLRRQAAAGGTHVRSLSLARTATWLTNLSVRPEPPVPTPTADTGRPAWIVDVGGPEAPVTAVAPPGRLGDRPLAWREAPAGYGTDGPGWRTA